MSDASTTQIQGWIERCWNGDNEARNELLEHTHGRLVKLARRRLHGSFAPMRDDLDTGDLINDLYVRLLERWERFIQPSANDAGRTPVHMYFSRAARIMCDILTDCLRARFGRRDKAKPQVVSLEDLVGGQNSSSGGFDPGSDTNNPVALAFWTEFHECLDALPEELRAVVDLHWFHELTHAEVGEVLGIAEATSRLRWAKVRVQINARFPENPFV